MEDILSHALGIHLWNKHSLERGVRIGGELNKNTFLKCGISVVLIEVDSSHLSPRNLRISKQFLVFDNEHSDRRRFYIGSC